MFTFSTNILLYYFEDFITFKLHGLASFSKSICFLLVAFNDIVTFFTNISNNSNNINNNKNDIYPIHLEKLKEHVNIEANTLPRILRRQTVSAQYIQWRHITENNSWHHVWSTLKYSLVFIWKNNNKVLNDLFVFDFVSLVLSINTQKFIQSQTQIHSHVPT